LTSKTPLHPCPICGGCGRQYSNYNDSAYFRCQRCEQAFTERLLTGGRIEVCYRAVLIREDLGQPAPNSRTATPETDPREYANSMNRCAG
jgi:DNA-directed RNA polymerase subunit RPC12/RpoP